MSNSNPVWHNIFRNIVLKPDNITFEAESYKDTLNILRGPGVAWQGTSDIDIIGATGSDQFMINVDYDISVPLATTDLTLEDVNGNTSTVTFTAGRGVEIVRNSAQELEWRSYSVTETDTLQTVTERNNITNNKIFVNNIEVGTISSSFTEDGFPSYDAGHDLAGSGTLNSPLQFSPEYKDSLMANSADQFIFTAVGPGTLAYSASYVFDTGATAGSVTLEREDPSSPGTWVVLDIISGVTLGYSYAIQGTYSELYSGNVNYRLTYTWTGNLGVITWHVQNTFEGGAYTPITSPQLKTDTTAKTVTINDLQFFENNIRTTVSNTDIVFDPNGTGRVFALCNVVAPTFVGSLNGNADTVTNGVYTTGSYSNPSWITSLAGTKVTNAVLTTGTYADPTWITSLDAAKIVGSISLSDITLDGTIRIYDNVIETVVSNANLELRANGTGVVYIPDQLKTTDNISIAKSTASITLGDYSLPNGQTIIYMSYGSVGAKAVITAGGVSTYNGNTDLDIICNSGGNHFDLRSYAYPGGWGPTGQGVRLRIEGSNGDIQIFNTTASTSTSTGALQVSGGVGIAGAIYAGSIQNTPIGSTTAAAGTFTTSTAAQIVRSGAVSASAWGTAGVGIRTVAGTFTDTTTPLNTTIAAAHINVFSQPSIAAAATNVTITDAATLYIANAPFNANVTITNKYALYVAAGATSLLGNLTVSGANAAINMSPTGVSGTITMNPVGGGSLDNFNVGTTTRGSGAFTTLAANNTVTIQTTTNNQSYTTTGVGTITISSGTTGSINNIQIGNTTAAAGKFTTVEGTTSVLSSGTGGVGYATGAGGTGSQATAKTDTVTINKPTGQITMNAAALNAATVVSFTLSNNTVAATDHVVVTHVSGGTLGGYTVTATANASSAIVYVRNNTAGSLSEALVLRFSVIKSINA